MSEQTTRSDATLDPAEIERFGRLAAEWWDNNGNFRTLHLIGPARLTFLRDAITRHFGRASAGLRPLEGLSILDVGCGGGLVCEPLARLGRRRDRHRPCSRNIEAARRHAAGQGLDIDYRRGPHRGPRIGGADLRCRGVPGGGGARAGRGSVPQDLRSWCGRAG